MFALIFHWKSLQRQIRIEGLIEKLNPKKSDKYYNSRHYLSRIGAWASQINLDRLKIEKN